MIVLKYFYTLLVALHTSKSSSIIFVNALSSTNPPAPSSSANNHLRNKVLRVCQSPGCKDDGAASTFDFLSAMAPPGIDVVRGSCVSLCGSGPVVEVCGDNHNNIDVHDAMLSIKKKKVKGSDAILSLLDECVTAMDGEVAALNPHLRDRLCYGYELSLKANEAYKSKNYQLAVELYTEAIESGRKPAMLLHEARIEFRKSADADDGSYSLQWLVASFKNSCRSRLALRDMDGARRDAFAATVFSRSLDADAYECLAEVCAMSSDAMGELQALKAAMKQYDRMEEEYSTLANIGADAPTRAEAAKKKNQAAARKRELGFCVTKLERVVGF